MQRTRATPLPAAWLRRKPPLRPQQTNHFVNIDTHNVVDTDTDNFVVPNKVYCQIWRHLYYSTIANKYSITVSQLEAMNPSINSGYTKSQSERRMRLDEQAEPTILFSKSADRTDFVRLKRFLALDLELKFGSLATCNVLLNSPRSA